MKRVSRREFVTVAGIGAAAAPFVLRAPKLHAAAPTAQEIVDRIKQRVGVAWKPETVDGFKAGDPSTPITGIVTTAMATMRVLQEAVAQRANLVITFEPTYYSRADSPTPPAGRRGGGPATPPPEAPSDPIFTAKRDFIAKNNLVVWRFNDHWRARTPDPLVQGLSASLGLARSAAADAGRSFDLHATTLDALVTDVKHKLGSRGGIRVVGDPGLRVQRIGLLPGSTPIQDTLKLLPTVDCVIAGEVREWESVEYARDLVTARQPKALITIGRIVSEDPGMRVCADWLGTIVPEVKAHWVTVGDPYWRPL
jgi:putative NIF3 family GTP cyclohydrolase 1 type 2